MSEPILFQIDRKSGVRDTVIASDRGLHILTVNCRSRFVRGREELVSIPFADQFVTAARARNGDGDVEIIIDAWDAEEWRQCADCARVIHRDLLGYHITALCADCHAARTEAYEERARTACVKAGCSPDDPGAMNRALFGVPPA